MDIFEWAASLPHEPGDELLCPSAPNLHHGYVRRDARDPFICRYCGAPDG